MCSNINTGYEATVLSLPERSVAYCTYINVTFKNWRYKYSRIPV